MVRSMTLSADALAEIAELRATEQPTRRAVVPAIEELLFEPLPVLDQGFIRVVDYMGDDAAVVQAARVSYGKGTKQVSTDQGLIGYLMRHRHTTPFEMCEIKLHVKLPIFVARQWIRHRTASVNEYSARYSVLDDGSYRPELDQLAAQATQNRQGRGESLDRATAEAARGRLDTSVAEAEATYRWLLGDAPGEPGLSRELARMVLPLSAYTQWYWKIDLHNLLHFIALRADSHAQYEIRAYAEVLTGIVEKWVPQTAAAFRDYRLDGAAISGRGLAVVKRLVKGEDVSAETSGMGAREWRELTALLELDTEG
jgi:thymidylate synthase (FAD)